MTGCLVCVNAVEAGTGRSWEHGSALYVAKSDMEYNRVVDSCAAAYERLPPDSLPRFGPEESVQAVREIGNESYVEVAFLSEAQILNLTGCNYKQLDLDLYQREAEDGRTIIFGCYVHFTDLPEDFSLLEVMGWRKVRFWSRTSTAALSHHLTPARQLRAGQAGDLMKYVDEQTPRPYGDKAGLFLAHIPKLGALMEKGAKKLSAKEEALAQKLAEQEAEKEREKEAAEEAKEVNSSDEEALLGQARVRRREPAQDGRVVQEKEEEEC